MYIGFKHLPGPEGHVINWGGGLARGFCPLQRDLANINVLKIMSLLFHKFMKYSSTFGENIGLYFVNISVNTWLDTFSH